MNTHANGHELERAHTSSVLSVGVCASAATMAFAVFSSLAVASFRIRIQYPRICVACHARKTNHRKIETTKNKEWKLNMRAKGDRRRQFSTACAHAHAHAHADDCDEDGRLTSENHHPQPPPPPPYPPACCTGHPPLRVRRRSFRHPGQGRRDHAVPPETCRASTGSSCLPLPSAAAREERKEGREDCGGWAHRTKN